MLKTQEVGITTQGHRIAEVEVHRATDCDGLDFVLVLRLRHQRDAEGQNWLTCFIDRDKAERLQNHLCEILSN